MVNAIVRIETWTLTSDLMKQLEATEMWFYAECYKDRVTNEEVLRRAKVDRTLMEDIVKRQMELLDMTLGRRNWKIYW